MLNPCPVLTGRCVGFLMAVGRITWLAAPAVFDAFSQGTGVIRNEIQSGEQVILGFCGGYPRIRSAFPITPDVSGG